MAKLDEEDRLEVDKQAKKEAEEEAIHKQASEDLQKEKEEAEKAEKAEKGEKAEEKADKVAHKAPKDQE